MVTYNSIKQGMILLLLRCCIYYLEYEVQELSSDDDAAIDGDDEVLPSGAVRKRKSAAQKDYIPPSHIQPSSGKS
jgi:hypothetical protein